MNRLPSLLIVGSAIAVVFNCSDKRYSDALSPEDALKSFRLAQGFKITLYAGEPDVVDPVELTFDENGNAFVVEMPEYPFEVEPGKGLSRIKLLRDNDGDGRIDDTIVFADSLTEATSMLPYQGGLLVTAAPHILYLKDTNADFVADTRETLFSGFFADNSEAQITSLRYGIDNWIYAANNGQQGEVTFNRNPQAPSLDMRGADFRFRLDRGQFERESGTAQFGHTIDDWGHRFVTQNTLHIRQVVIPGRYLNRNPHLASRNAMVNISDHDLEMFQETPPPYWRAERTRRRQQQYNEQKLDRIEYAEDHFTGCSGGTVYDGQSFPSEYYGNIFTGDVAGNLVHRDVLVVSDSTPHLVAQRHPSEADREFLASTDPWFRPAGFAVGPDGYLYVVDMYRQHIETPVSIPEDLKADMDFLNGSDKGRIYRIAPDNASTHKDTSPNLSQRSSSELVDLLAHSGRWWRLNAQRLLVERHDTSIVGAVTLMFQNHEDARARLHCLYVLEGLDALSPSIISRAIDDASPGVRRHGLILGERNPSLLTNILSRIEDENIDVALQATLSLGQFSGTSAEMGLARVMATKGSDPWFRVAVLCAPNGTSIRILERLINEYSFFANDLAWKAEYLHDISTAIGSANDRKAIDELISILLSPSMTSHSQWQVDAVAGLKNGLAKSASDQASRDALTAVPVRNPQEAHDALMKIKKMYNSSGRL